MDEAFRELREREFSRLDETGHVYLDYTGAGLYTESQVRRHAELLRSGVFGNPHSRNPTSRASTTLVQETRRRIHEFFDADPETYEVVFTPNATGALKLVGEAYPFREGSRFVLTADNHNSINGIREYAAGRNAAVHYVPLGEDLRVADLDAHLKGADPERPNLFAYAAQSNFSGVKHPLEWVERAHAAGYDVLLDAAAYAPTSPLSLGEVQPDFVCLSFYKMFGYPTGVGALIARREALQRLERPWFCGGTVRFVSAQNQIHILYDTSAGFEDGTLNYLSIAAVRDGLDLLDELGMDRVNRHVLAMTDRLLGELKALRHGNGRQVAVVYGPDTTEARGGTVAFNILDPDGNVVDFRVVEERASDANISLRTGYFCNPGAAETAFRYRPEEAERCFHESAKEEIFTFRKFSACMAENAVGAVRVSVGIATNAEDIRRLMAVLGQFRDAVTEPGTMGAVPVAVRGA